MKRSTFLVLMALTMFALWGSAAFAEFGGLPGYAGSHSCKECHPDIYDQWKLTPHARMLVNAERDPSAILADDFNDEIPFTKDDIAYTVGSHWIQKYLTRIDDVLYQLPKYWNVAKREWEPYSIWNWRQQPYNIHCDGCHTVGFDAQTESFFEPAIGCESCHGPGQKHAQTGGRASAIVNPDNLEPDFKLMVCMACHTDGQDTTYEKYPFPVGYQPGKDLTAFSSDFFMPKPKSKRWYWGTMDFMERKRMFYFYQSKFYSTNRACEVCGFDRGVSNTKERYMSRSEYCGTCHMEHITGYETHAGHTQEQTICTDCHIPEMVENNTKYSIHDHKFDFSKPKMACSECHDKEDPDDDAVNAIAEDGTVTWAAEPEHHDFHFEPVKYPKTLPTRKACLLCHEGKDIDWTKEKITEGIGATPILR